MIGLDLIDHLTGGRLGTFDVPCPECGPLKRTIAKQRKKTMRIWRVDHGFATFNCERCGEQGHTRDPRGGPPNPVKHAEARAEAAQRDRSLKAERLSKAMWLWRMRQPLRGTIAETYLREARGYGGPLPATLGFLPARGSQPPAMIAAFGLAHEIEPGVLAIADTAVTGVHLTRLKPDGSSKAVFDDPDENAKIMVGHSTGSPIVLAPPNDLRGMAIVEGIEDGLSTYEATGLGVWAAGAASRMPALADKIPSYIEVCTVVVDDDRDGRRHAAECGRRIETRGIEARLILPARCAA
jgi:hypothetical protein